LTSSPVLNSPDYEKKFYLQTDASERGIGAVLSQQDKEGSDHPIAFFSRKLLPRETRYATVEKECLAIVAALKHFSVYLLGTHFTVLTDHQALQYLATMRNSNGRLSRWALSLQPFSFDIFHKPGILNGNAGTEMSFG
jgi:phospholipid-translocating ATPase